MNKADLEASLKNAQHHLEVAAHALEREDWRAFEERLWSVSHWADNANSISRDLNPATSV